MTHQTALNAVAHGSHSTAKGAFASSIIANQIKDYPHEIIRSATPKNKKPEHKARERDYRDKQRLISK